MQQKARMERLMQKLELESYDDPEEEIRRELEKIRIRAEVTAAATAAVWAKNKVDNKASRLKYERAEKKRRAEEQQKRIAQYNKLASMYDNSPFRHDVGKIYFAFEEKKAKQKKLDDEAQRIYQTLDSMTGKPRVDVVKLAPQSAVQKITHDPIAKIELERRNTLLETKVLKEEQAVLAKMVDDCVKKTYDRFPIIAMKLAEAEMSSLEGNPGSTSLAPTGSLATSHKTIRFK